MKKTHLPLLKAFYPRKFSAYLFSLFLFLALCFNVIFASSLYGATGEAITRNTAYAIGILLLVTISLSLYLFIVIFQPERF
jgi:K+-transporting ATPase KdpF subunit